jgi:hypothetical protein
MLSARASGGTPAGAVVYYQQECSISIFSTPNIMVVKRKVFFLMLVICCVTFFTSCSKLVEVHCTPAESYAKVVFIGFDSTDIQTLIIVKYSNDGLFNNPIDTSIQHLIYNHYSNTDTFPAYIHHDTIVVSDLGGLNDWIVKADPVGMEWRVSDITYGDQVRMERPSSSHVNDKFSCPLTGYKVNGQQKEGLATFYLSR